MPTASKVQIPCKGRFVAPSDLQGYNETRGKVGDARKVLGVRIGGRPSINGSPI
jgi:hypothetical protein